MTTTVALHWKVQVSHPSAPDRAMGRTRLSDGSPLVIALGDLDPRGRFYEEGRESWLIESS